MKKRLTQNQIEGMQNLAKEGRSIRDISDKFQIGRSTVHYHVRNYCQKMTTFDVTRLEEGEEGYVIGLFLGDGSFNRGNKDPRFFVRFALDAERDKDIAIKLAQIFGKVGKKINFISWKSNTIAKTCSKELVAYIKSYVTYEEGEKTLLQSETWSDNFRFGFIAGIIDSDGHVHPHLGTEIKTVSRKNFERVSSIFEKLGISTNTRIREASADSFSKKPRYIIYIPSSQMKRIKGSIPSTKIARYL